MAEIRTTYETTHLQFWVVWGQKWDSCWSQGTGSVVQVSSMVVKDFQIGQFIMGPYVKQCVSQLHNGFKKGEKKRK